MLLTTALSTGSKYRVVSHSGDIAFVRDRAKELIRCHKKVAWCSGLNFEIENILKNRIMSLRKGCEALHPETGFRTKMSAATMKYNVSDS